MATGFRGAIFDVDGVLVDSPLLAGILAYHWRAKLEARLGLVLYRYTGRNWT